jgi:hypothetical protein
MDNGMNLVIQKSQSLLINLSVQVFQYISKIAQIVLKAISAFVETVFLKAKSYLFSSKRMCVHLASFLMHWKIQAIYLRIELYLVEIYNYFLRKKSELKEANLEKTIGEQKQIIQRLREEYEALSKELSVYRKEVLEGYQFQIEIAKKNEEIALELESEKRQTYRLKAKEEIQKNEQEFITLFNKVMECYEKFSSSDDVFITTELNYVLETLIPRWKLHMESSIKMLEELQDQALDKESTQQIVQKIIALSKRPLTLTEMILRMNSLIIAKTKQKTDSAYISLDMTGIDPKVIQAADALEALLKSSKLSKI